jgi:hypothetical protein
MSYYDIRHIIQKFHSCKLGAFSLYEFLECLTLDHNIMTSTHFLERTPQHNNTDTMSPKLSQLRTDVPLYATDMFSSNESIPCFVLMDRRRLNPYPAAAAQSAERRMHYLLPPIPHGGVQHSTTCSTQISSSIGKKKRHKYSKHRRNRHLLISSVADLQTMVETSRRSRHLAKTGEEFQQFIFPLLPQF